MSGNCRDLTASREKNKLGPDLFGFYAHEAAELLSHDEGLLSDPHQGSHSADKLHAVDREKGQPKDSFRAKGNNGIIDAASLFLDGLGAQLSDFKKERLRALLQQSVFSLTQEVDEMVNPVVSVCRIRSCLRYKESLLSSNASGCNDEQLQHPQKKHKILPTCSETKLSDDIIKKCTQCHSTETIQWRPGPDDTKYTGNRLLVSFDSNKILEPAQGGDQIFYTPSLFGESLCDACGLRYRNDLKNELADTSNVEAGRERAEIDDDLQLILENDASVVEGLLKKHSGELSDTLNHMEQKLEELLNITMSTCRPMTITEKQRLRKLIQTLPPTNLDRVVDIIARNKPSEKSSCDEVYVDLDEQDNVTLWRLYFYIQTIHASAERKNDADK